MGYFAFWIFFLNFYDLIFLIESFNCAVTEGVCGYFEKVAMVPGGFLTKGIDVLYDSPFFIVG